MNDRKPRQSYKQKEPTAIHRTMPISMQYTTFHYMCCITLVFLPLQFTT